MKAATAARCHSGQETSRNQQRPMVALALDVCWAADVTACAFRERWKVPTVIADVGDDTLFACDKPRLLAEA